ncbi:MAG: zinc ABC transporter substrate-binding protein [Mariprofundaceae bacterium]|nr:zinc ABC transporter substrate-binding protein [Mariprofundaceae bacterium]
MATLPPLASVMHMLDKNMQVQCILGNNSDPHHMSISPQQFEAIKKTLVLRTTEDKYWKFLRPKSAFYFWRDDPHAWLHPEKVHKVLPEVAAYFKQEKILFQGDVIAAQERVLKIQKQLAQALDPLKTKGVIMQHGAWLSVFEAYGVPVRLVLEKGNHHGKRASPKRLQTALDLIDLHPDMLLIGDKQHDTDALQWLKSKRPQSPLLILDTLGDCQQTWDALMQENISLIKGSL